MKGTRYIKKGSEIISIILITVIVVSLITAMGVFFYKVYQNKKEKMEKALEKQSDIEDQLLNESEE